MTSRVVLKRIPCLAIVLSASIIEEAKKTRLEIETLSGDDVESEMREIMNQPREVIERVRKLTE